MNDETREIWDAICRKALNRSLDDCPPVHVSGLEVAEPLHGIVTRLGPMERKGVLATDDLTDEIVCLWIKAACETGAFAPLKAFKAPARDLAREYVGKTLVMAMLMARSEEPYGPFPSGLRGDDLALAALALEILENRSPQRLITQERDRLH